MTRIRITAGARITAGWIVASGLTALAWVLAARQHLGSGTPEALAVLAIAAVKARIVTQEFMGARRAPRWLRAAIDGWFVVFWATSVLALLY